MTVPYRPILEKIRLAFPQPVSDRVHDSYFVHSIMRALDQVDAMKSQLPVLGVAKPLDFAQARLRILNEKSCTLEEVSSELVKLLEGLQIFGHPLTQQNVITQPTIASVIGMLLSAVYNPNLAWDEHSRQIAVAEVEAVAMTARLVGYDPARAGGLFTFGGTGTNLYAARLGLEKACPGTMRRGAPGDAVLLASDSSHYCRHTIAGWLGIGTDRVITVPTTDENEIHLEELEHRARAVLSEGKRIAAIIATMGTTDAFGIDNLEAIVALRDKWVEDFSLSYRPHVHADAVIGWAWSVFNDYDAERNALGFRRRTVRALAGACRRIRHLHLADSIGIDFHKTGFAPYVSSMILLKDANDFQLLSRDAELMPYLYHSGEYRPGMYSLETSRSGTGILAAWANLRLFGMEGLRATIGHLVEMAQLLREILEGHKATAVLNRDNFGTVTLFRAYPPDVDTFSIKRFEATDPRGRELLLRHNSFNRRVYEYVHDEAMAGRGVLISLTDCYRQTTYGEPIVALKSYILSPFVDEENVHAVVERVLEACQKIAP